MSSKRIKSCQRKLLKRLVSKVKPFKALNANLSELSANRFYYSDKSSLSRFFRNLEQGQSVLDSQLTSLNVAVDHIKQDVRGTSIGLSFKTCQTIDVVALLSCIYCTNIKL